MIGCTILSRVADSMTIPRVKVDNIKSKTIIDNLTAQGRVIKNREEKISVVEGLKINHVNISEGSVIKSGDVLAELDVEDLQKKVGEIKKNINQNQKTLTRANEDYNKAINLKKQKCTKCFKGNEYSKKSIRRLFKVK